MQKYIFLLLVVVFIANCSPDPEPPINPNLREDVNGIIFKIGNKNEACGFVFSGFEDGVLFYNLTKNLPDSLSNDYQRVTISYETTSEIINCTYNHPDFDIGEDSTNFQIINILEAVPL
jgi:hypothetical protein